MTFVNLIYIHNEVVRRYKPTFLIIYNSTKPFSVISPTSNLALGIKD